MFRFSLAIILLELISAFAARAAVVRAWPMMHRWPRQTVHYYLDQTDEKWIHKPTEQPRSWTYDSSPEMWGLSIERTIEDGLAMLTEANPGLRFVRLSEPDAKRFPHAVRFRQRPEILVTGMATANGFSNGRSARYEIHINKWNHAGIVAHEMLHILGVSHAQSAANRETYAIVYTGQTYLRGTPNQFTVPDNVRTGRGNFNLLTGRRILGAYDFDSIMHYSDSIMKKRGRNNPPALPKVTIGRRISPGPLTGVRDSLPGSGIHYREADGNGRSYDAQRSRLSPIDRWALREMYFHTTSPETGPDFNGDGFADLIVAADSGTHLIHGGVYGSDSPGLDRLNIPGATKRLPFAGEAVICGDFNGDYRMDAAVHTDDGIEVFYAARDNEGRGGKLGMRPKPARLDAINSEPGDWATGDFNGDGCSDLAIGEPSETEVRLRIHRGGSRGLKDFRALNLSIDRPKQLKIAFAAGDFNGDGFTDLAWVIDGGPLRVLRGSKQGLSQPTETIPPRSQESWGDSPAVGDFDCDGLQDLAIASAAHKIVVFYGERRGSGFNADSRRQLISAQVGKALLAADMNGDGYSDLAIGNPVANGVGSIQILNGSRSGLLPSTVKTLHPEDVGINAPEDGLKMGWSLARGDFDGNGYVDLVIGMPGKTVGGKKNAGQMVVRYHGSPHDGPNTVIGRSFPSHVILDRQAIDRSESPSAEEQFGAILE